MNLRTIRYALFLYALFDFFIGGYCGGFLPLTPMAAAQFTTVTGTVIDPNSLPYAGGTISATLVTSASPTLNGLAYTPPTQPTGLNQAGFFTIRLADNTVLLPAATQWKFIVCSAIGTVNPAIGKGSVCFSAGPITISGASQDISATLNAAALALTLLTGGGGTTINPTNTFLPDRLNATTFEDSPLFRSGGSVTNQSTPASSTFNSVSATSQLNSFLTATDTGAVTDAGFTGIANVNPAGASSANYASFFANLSTPAANTQNFSGSLIGMLSQVQHNGSGNLTFPGSFGGLNGFGASSQHNGSGTIGRNYALHGQSYNIGSGTVTFDSAIHGVSGVGVTATGTTTTDATVLIDPPSLSGSGGTMTHHYAVRALAGQTGGTGNPDGWAFFSDPADKNQFGTTTILGAQPQLTVGSNGGIAGQICLAGSTSGCANLTAPAIAGTTTNALTSSNVITSPGVFFVTGSSPASATGVFSSAQASNLDFPINGVDQLFMNLSLAEFRQPLCGPFGAATNCLTFTAGQITTANSTTMPVGTVELGYNVNVTPVTVSANVTTDQNLMAKTIPAGDLNLVGRTLRVFVAGIYSTPAASTATITIELKLCSVSGCGSGNVADLIDITSSANPGTVTNNAFNLTAYVTTQTAGAAGRWEAHGIFGIDLGALNTSPDSFFNDTNTAVIAGTPADIDTTAQNFLQVSIAFSAASASNSATERQLVVEVVN